LTRDAAVVEPGADGKMMQLRAGTNGWVCLPGSPNRPACGACYRAG
jgi:hypothetical protein